MQSTGSGESIMVTEKQSAQQHAQRRAIRRSAIGLGAIALAWYVAFMLLRLT